MTFSPFALSLSKCCTFFPPFKEGQGFDKLSPNGGGVNEAHHG